MNAAAASPSLLRRWESPLGWMLLAAIPIAMYFGFFLPRFAKAGLTAVADFGDASFYSYQFSRMTEVGGAWWRLGDDPTVGWPYRTLAEQHPGLYEGVDLIFLSWITRPFLDPATNHFAMLLAITIFNAMVAGGLARRWTGAWWPAFLAAFLVNANFSFGRILVHPHLVKYGWCLLACSAFVRFHQSPNWKRGIWLGAAGALASQGSLYLGYFTVVVLGTCWLSLLLAGRLGRAHLVSTLVAGAAAVAVAAILLFPVFEAKRQGIEEQGFSARSLSSQWVYSAELWSYLTRPFTALANHQQAGAVGMAVEGGSHYPGVTCLLVLVGYFILRGRGRQIDAPNEWPIGFWLAMTALYLILSLRGGPGTYLHAVAPAFRCYGRAGGVAMALLAVAVPVVLFRFRREESRLGVRVAVAIALTASLGFDLRDIHRWNRTPINQSLLPAEPAWVGWLTRQPEDTRLVAFSDKEMAEFNFVDLWNWGGPAYRLRHHHVTLNGGSLNLIQADLLRLGCPDMKSLTPAGLKAIVSLGYDAIACDDGFTRRNPWIAALPGFEIAATSGGETIYRAGSAASRFPNLSKKEILRRGLGDQRREVPAAVWITEGLDLKEVVVAGDRSEVRMRWTDANGVETGPSMPGLMIHVYGPDIPAYLAPTPREPGDYALVFRGPDGEEWGRRLYRVVAVPSTRPAFAEPIILPAGSLAKGARFRITNDSSAYWCVNPPRTKTTPASLHPTVNWFRPGANGLVIQTNIGAPDAKNVIVPLIDLPPGASQEIVLDAEATAAWPKRDIRVYLEEVWDPGWPQRPKSGSATVRILD